MTETETTIPGLAAAPHISLKPISKSTARSTASIRAGTGSAAATALTASDEERLQDSRTRNLDGAKLVAKSVNNKTVTHQLPLYFGTDADEFTVFQRRALSDRRTAVCPGYPKTTRESYGRRLSQRITVKILAPRKEVKETETETEVVKETETETETTKETVEETVEETVKEPASAERLHTPTPQTQPSPQQHTQSQPQPQTRTSASAGSGGMKWSEAIQRGLRKSNSGTPQTPTPASPANGSGASSSSTATAGTSVSGTAMSSLVTPASLSKASSAADSDSDELASTPDSAYIPDNSVRPLGSVALKVMYDGKYLPSVISSRKSDLITPHGLMNTGNICYMNAVLQMLFECEPFSQLLNIIRLCTVASLGESKTPLFDALLILHDQFKKKQASGQLQVGPGKNNVVNPHPFYLAISKTDRFRNLEWGKQEDAEEFLGYLLDGLHEELVDAIGSVTVEDAEKIAGEMTDRDSARRVINAVKVIKGEETADGSNESAEDGGGWNEVGAKRKIAVKRTFEFKPSPIAQLFGGQFRSILQTQGRKSSITLDPFMHIQLDIDDPETVDLVTAFKKFAEVEEISYGNQKAKKQNLIDRLPHILIVHLKRFAFTVDEDGPGAEDYELVSSSKRRNKNHQSQDSYDAAAAAFDEPKRMLEGRIEKIHKQIRYDHELVLPQQSIALGQDPAKYKLVGVIYHHGRTAEGGHYTADVRQPSGDWIRIDDTQISHISPEEVTENGRSGGILANNNKTAYLLMYEKE